MVHTGVGVSVAHEERVRVLDTNSNFVTSLASPRPRAVRNPQRRRSLLSERRRIVAEKEFLGDRRRAQEEEYFQKREQELIAKLQQRGREEATRRQMAERTGVADEEILRDLEV